MYDNKHTKAKNFMSGMYHTQEYFTHDMREGAENQCPRPYHLLTHIVQNHNDHTDT